MIDKLIIENFALIDHLELDLKPGLNILSGETGAGKSIVIDALTLLSGGRASGEFIRTGFDKSVITGVFSVTLEKSKEIKEKFDIEVDEEQLIITRELYSNGKSIAKINNKMVTVSILKDVTKDMIDIHGQHEHHSLLDPQKHLELLDMFGGQGTKKLLDKYIDLYETRKRILTQLDKLDTNVENRERKMDLLKFEIEEITACDLKIGEDEELNNKRKMLINAEKLYNGAMQGYLMLYQGDEVSPVVEVVGTILDELNNLTRYDPKLAEFASQLEAALFQIQDVSRGLLAYGETLELDTEALTQVEMRIDEVNRMKRKYGSTIEEILKYLDNRNNELDQLVNSEERFKQLQSELSALEKELLITGTELTEVRKEAASKLSDKITEQLGELSMEKTVFHVQFNQNIEVKFTDKGLDTVEFLISPNPGEPLKPLAKIASGGEMSRIMLSMKNILAEIDKIETLIFDEVDTGIGGRTAQKVAEKLINVSKGRQVICVSHLPQICVMANTHYKIVKNEVNGRTVSTIIELEEIEKITEIARMISGAEVTQATINHAREMLSLAQGFK